MGCAAPRQIGAQRLRLGRIVEDEQDTLIFMSQPLQRGGERRLLLIVCADPAEPQTKGHESARRVGSVWALIHQVAR